MREIEREREVEWAKLLRGGEKLAEVVQRSYVKHVAAGTRSRVTPYAFGSRATAETQLAPLLGREKSRPARRRNGSEKLPPFDTATFFKLESFGDEYRDSLIREIAHSFFKEKRRDEEEKNTTKNRRG